MMSPEPAPRSRLWIWTKRLLKTGTLLVIAAVPTVYFGAPVLARQEKVRHRVESALTRSLGTPVEMTSMAWSWKDGLTLRELHTTHESAEAAFNIVSLQVLPNFQKVFRGKSGLRVLIDSPEVIVQLTDADQELRLPKFCRKGLRLEDVEVRNGSLTVNGVHLKGISSRGNGRLANHAADLTLSAFDVSFNDMTVTGRGELRLTEDGLSGELEVREAAAVQSSDLQKALGTLKITLKQASSETRWY